MRPQHQKTYENTTYDSNRPLLKFQVQFQRRQRLLQASLQQCFRYVSMPYDISTYAQAVKEIKIISKFFTTLCLLLKVRKDSKAQLSATIEYI